MVRNDFRIGGTAKWVVKEEHGESKFFLEILASTADIDLEDDIISGDALRGAQHDLLKNNTVLLGHDRAEILGSTVESEFTPPKNLKLVLLISNTREKEQQMIRENALNKASIGGRMLNWKEEIIEGKKVRVITRIRLHEVSLVSLPANQEARALRWWVDKTEGVLTLGIGEDFSQNKGGGDIQNMDDPLKKDQPGGGDVPGGSDAPVDTAVATGFEFDPAELDQVGKDVQADARAMETREKMLHITGRLKSEAPDEGVAKAAEALESLISQLPIGGGSVKSEADIKMEKLESLMLRIEAGQSGEVVDKVETPKAPAAPAQPRVVIRKGAGPQGGEPIPTPDADPDAAINADLKLATSREQKFAILRKYKRLSVPAQAA